MPRTFTKVRGIVLAPTSGMTPPCSCRRSPFLLFLLLFVSSLAACKGDGGGPVGLSPSIAGDWNGTAKAYTVQFSATFTQDGDAVGGAGHFSSPVASDDFTVSGTLAGREVSLLLTSSEIGTTSFIGRFTARDRIEGTLALPGEDLDLTLDRD
jgi:hypothetical protein